MSFLLAFAPLFLALTPSPQSGGDPGANVRLVLEGLDGTTRRVSPEGYRTSDPRADGTWIVRVEGFPPPPPDEAGGTGPRARIGLADGDLLHGRIVGGEGEALALELFPGVELALGIDRIRSLVLEDNLPENLAAPLEAPPEGDRAYRRTGSSLDREDGAIVAFAAEGVLFESELLGQRLVRWGELAALFVEVFDDGADSGAAESEVPVAVDLANGGRIRGRLVELSGEGCRLALGGGAEIRLPLARIAQVALDDGALTFLSDLPVLREEGRGDPFGDGLGMEYPHRLDAEATARGPLVAGGRRYVRGIGTHAPTRVTWALDPAWRTLRGAVAVDDSVLRNEAHGTVIFRILVDGEARWESPVMRGGDHPLEIPPLDLGETEAPRELTLEADMVEELDSAGDRADWLRMILVRG